MIKKRRRFTILQYLTINIIVVSIFFLGMFYFIWVKYEFRRFNSTVQKLRHIFLESKKEALKSIVEQFYRHIEISFDFEKRSIENQIDAFLLSIDKTNGVKSVKSLCEQIHRQNKIINFAIVKRDFFYSTSSYVSPEMFKDRKKFEILRGKKLRNGIRVYLYVLKRDFSLLIKNSLLSSFKDVSFNYSGYLFIVDSNGRILLSAHRLMNVDIEDMSKRFGEQTKRIILDKALKEGSGFVEYTWYKPDLRTVSRKVSYIKYNRKIGWIVGAGVYLDDIERSFLPVFASERGKFYDKLKKITFLMIVILLLDLSFLFILLGGKLKRDFATLNSLFVEFEKRSVNDIKNFNCQVLSFRETCEFGIKFRESLIKIKEYQEKLEKTNVLLQENKEKFEKLARSITNAVVVIDEDMNLEFFNPEFCRLFSCEFSEMGGANFLEFFPVEVRREIISMIDGLRSSKILLGKRKLIDFEINKQKKHIEFGFSKIVMKNMEKIICTMVDVTEREKLLENLKFLTGQFEKAEKMAKVGNWIYYPEKKVFWASKESFRIYGIDYNGGSLIGADVINSLILEEDKDIAFKTTIYPLKFKKPFEGTFRVKTSKGELKYLISRSEPVMDENGVVKMVEGVLKDITDLKKMEQEIERQLNLLQKTQDIARIAYFEYSLQDRTLCIMSPFFNRLLNGKEFELEKFFALVDERDREKVEHIFEKEFREDHKIINTFTLNIPDSELTLFTYIESEHFNKEKGVRSGWLQDISRIKKLEEEIEIEKEKLVKMVNALSEGVAILDSGFRFIFVNDSFKRIFRSEIFDRESIFEFFRRFTIDGLSEAINKGNIFKSLDRHKKYRLLFQDVEVIVNFEIKQLLAANSSDYILIVEDITHKEKYTEQVIKTQNIRLLNKIAASLAHDLNNLLGSILGKISILEKEASALGIEKDMQKIMRNIKIARALATQFLTFSKSGKPVLKNIGRNTIEQTINDLSDFVFSGTSIIVEKIIEKDLWAIKGDNTQIAQIILNLFSNARDVLDESGKVTVEVSNFENNDPTSSCEPGDYVLIKISDNGPGIPEEKLKNIFEFFVGYKKEGFGLGLAIVKNIVDAHSGCINVTSEKGKGTTFYILLPAERGFFSVSEESKERGYLYEKDVALSDLRLAVLEDEEPMQETIYDLMNYIAIEGEIYSKGEELIEAIKSGNRYDIALLDLTVKGGLGGLDIIKELKKLSPGIFAIVSSGYSQDPVIARFGEYGFDGALPKPYTLEEFRDLMLECAKKIKGT